MDRGNCGSSGPGPMISTFIIVFREILEAALVIGVAAAAVKGWPRRGLWVALGATMGIAGAALVAGSIGALSRLAHGSGQELFAAAVLFAAGLLLAWHNIWMAEHGRELALKLKTLGSDVLRDKEPLWMLIGVTALAVMREGSEIALFLYGIAAGGVGKGQLLLGGALGLAAGAAVGLILFTGLSRIPVARLFRVSAIIMLFIAAGMIARGAQVLVQADLLPPLVNRVWDSSNLISGEGLLGRSLGALIGYTPAPSLMQLLFWMASLLTIGLLMLAKRSHRAVAPRERRAALAAIAALAGGLASSGNARAADYQVYAPYVVRGENEVEARTYADWGATSETGPTHGVQIAFGRGLTDRWATEFYGEGEQEYGEHLKLEEFEWENRVQLTPQGKYWLDVGLLNENELPRFGHDPFQTSLGPELARDFGRVTALLDLLVVGQYGSNAQPGVHLDYRAHLEYRWSRALSPLLEAYGGSGVSNVASGHPRYQLGPGVSGQIQVAAGRVFQWTAVVLFGVTSASPGGTLLVRGEYEFY